MKKQELRSFIKEVVKHVLNEYEDFDDQISRALRQARKEKNAEKVLYYRQSFGKSAMASWEQFKGSWAYGEWVKKNADEIEKVKQELKRFSYMEESQSEPYDSETDSFSPGPRYRLQGEENDLGIPEYPNSMIKQHTFDGKPMWFVYSSSDPQALILGFGNSDEDAINNAKDTAKYIKHGGVGHTGELKEGDEDGTSYGVRDKEFGQDYPNPPEPNPSVVTLQWAKKRLKREGNRLNRDTLERVIKMLEDELKQKWSSSNEPTGV